MDKNKTIDVVIAILQNLSKEQQALHHQLISANELLASVIIENTINETCQHPKEHRLNLTCIGDEKKTEQCKICGDTIISEW